MILFHIRSRFFGFTAIFFLCVTSCAPAASPKQPQPTQPAATPPQVFKRQLTSFEQSLMREPGLLHGTTFRHSELEKKVSAIHPAQPAASTYQQLLQWLHDDYRPLVAKTANFSVDIEPFQPKPTEALNLDKRTHFAILLDASGSMAETIGTKTKMDSAKRAISTFISRLPAAATISLRVYGHKGSNQPADKKLSCQSTEAIIAATRYEPDSFKKALDTVKPTGWTPIATALEAGKQDIPSTAEEVHLYLISDGEETCGGNPVQVLSQWRQQPIRPHFHIIGFRVDTQGQTSLKQMAAAGAGTFTYVDNATELDRYLEKEHKRLMQTWLRWGQLSGSEALKLRQQKLSELDRLFREWENTSTREANHLNTALHLLNKAGYPVTEIDKVKQLIDQRIQQLDAYRTATHRSLQEAVEKKGWEQWNGIWEEGTDHMKEQWNTSQGK